MCALHPHFSPPQALQHSPPFVLAPRPGLYLDSCSMEGWHKGSLIIQFPTEAVFVVQEPAIFAWDLMNEPRAACDVHAPNASCTASAADSIQVDAAI